MSMIPCLTLFIDLFFAWKVKSAEIFHQLICWFTPETAPTHKDKPGQSQNPITKYLWLRLHYMGHYKSRVNISKKLQIRGEVSRTGTQYSDLGCGLSKRQSHQGVFLTVKYLERTPSSKIHYSVLSCNKQNANIFKVIESLYPNIKVTVWGVGLHIEKATRVSIGNFVFVPFRS